LAVYESRRSYLTSGTKITVGNEAVSVAQQGKLG